MEPCREGTTFTRICAPIQSLVYTIPRKIVKIKSVGYYITRLIMIANTYSSDLFEASRNENDEGNARSSFLRLSLRCDYEPSKSLIQLHYYCSSSTKTFVEIHPSQTHTTQRIILARKCRLSY